MAENKGDEDIEDHLAAFEAEVAALDVDLEEGKEEVEGGDAKAEESTETNESLAKSEEQEDEAQAGVSHAQASSSSSSMPSSAETKKESSSSVAAFAQPQLNQAYLDALESRASNRHQRRMGSYSAEDDKEPSGSNSTSTSVGAQQGAGADGAGDTSESARGQKRALRVGAAGRFEDKTLEEWPENDFRLWVGQLGNDVNDGMLKSKFADYKSFNMARVIRNRKTRKSKGYGIVSFSDPMEMVRAMREQQSKYCGTRRMQIRRSRAEDRDLSTVQKKNKKRKQAMDRLGVF
ncbi:RNA-binding protein 42 [Hondaea fermentalgiana]|uniref:RNA-binding protein 42 n=1 Tax=Hondaea fermentalgiana TaxID=2315210 RepID=A0A2R5G8C1_9STRA|nr:RNA-binding protein 42 [Hondaea fermentalgiana]|eukprot:GBG24291.1 RNA-binding protein 42 [Hondaea fermentalgiana]